MRPCLDSKVDILDTPDFVTKKIRRSIAVPEAVGEKGLLAFVESSLLLPQLSRTGENLLLIEVPTKWSHLFTNPIKASMMTVGKMWHAIY